MADGTEEQDFESMLSKMSTGALKSAGLGSMLGEEISQAIVETPAEAVEEAMVEQQTLVSKPVNTPVEEDMTVDELLVLGETKTRQRDINGALAIFNKIISLDPSSDMAWFNRGVLLEGQRDARGAKQAFNICLDLNPDHAPATANMAVLLERMGEFDDAAKMAKKALNFYPGHPTIMAVLDRTSQGSGKEDADVQDDSEEHTYQKASLAKAMKESGVKDAEAVIREARHHDLNQDKHLDIEELRSASNIVAAQEEAIQYAEETKVEQETIPEAEVITEIAQSEFNKQETKIPEKESTPDIEDIIISAKKLVAEGDAKAGLKLLKPHLQGDAAQNPEAWLVAGICMAKIELYPNAIQAVKYSIQLSQTASAFHNLAKIYVACSDNSEAINSWKSAIELDKQHKKSILGMIDLSKSLGDVESYFFAMDSLIDIEPNNELKQQYITDLLDVAEGESVILENVDSSTVTIPEGPSLAKKASELIDDKNSKEMARAYSLMNDHPSAIAVWKAMIQTDKENPDYWKGLAKALEFAGDLETAAKCHAKANMVASSSQVQIESQSSAGQEAVAARMESASTREAPLLTQEIPQVTSIPLPSSNQGNESTSVQSIQPVAQSPELASNEPSGVTQASNAANILLSAPVPRPKQESSTGSNPQVDLAKFALDATSKVNDDLLAARAERNESPERQAMQAREWFNRGTQLLEDKKYRQALNCFDKALTYFGTDEDKMVLCLNARGNVFYYLEDYKKCVESYLQAMRLKPTEVKGQTLYNMGTAYAAMERYPDAIKCFEQAIPRGLSKAEEDRCKTQIKRCKAIQKAANKRQGQR